MNKPPGADAVSDDKATREAARRLVAEYHQEELRGLLERVRAGFTSLDAGEIDEFELDDLVHQYKKASAKLWAFCGSSGGSVRQAADTLSYLRERGEETPDWWDLAAPRERDRES